MCSNCRNNAALHIFIGVVLLGFVFFLLAVVCGGAAHGAEVKAIPLATANQTESPVIAKAMGFGGKPESHDIPKFDLPPAGGVAAVAGIGIAAIFLFVAQLSGVAVITIVVVVGSVWAFRKFFGVIAAKNAAVPLLAALDKLVASHRANSTLSKAVHSRLSKILPIVPAVAAPKKSRKKKVNEKSAG